MGNVQVTRDETTLQPDYAASCVYIWQISAYPVRSIANAGGSRIHCTGHTGFHAEDESTRSRFRSFV